MPSFLPLPSLLKSRFEAPSHNAPHPPPTLDTQTGPSPVCMKAEAVNQPDFVSYLGLQIVLPFSAGEIKKGWNLLADFWCFPEKGLIGALLEAKPTRVSMLSNPQRQLSCLWNKKNRPTFSPRYLLSGSRLAVSRSTVTAEVSLRASSTSGQTSQPRPVLGWVGDELKLPPPVRNWKLVPTDTYSSLLSSLVSLTVWKPHPIPSKPVSIAEVGVYSRGRPADGFCFQRHWDEWAGGAVTRSLASVCILTRWARCQTNSQWDGNPWEKS